MACDSPLNCARWRVDPPTRDASAKAFFDEKFLWERVALFTRWNPARTWRAPRRASKRNSVHSARRSATGRDERGACIDSAGRVCGTNDQGATGVAASVNARQRGANREREHIPSPAPRLLSPASTCHVASTAPAMRARINSSQKRDTASPSAYLMLPGRCGRRRRSKAALSTRTVA